MSSNRVYLNCQGHKNFLCKMPCFSHGLFLMIANHFCFQMNQYFYRGTANLSVFINFLSKTNKLKIVVSEPKKHMKTNQYQMCNAMNNIFVGGQSMNHNIINCQLLYFMAKSIQCVRTRLIGKQDAIVDSWQKIIEFIIRDCLRIIDTW